MRIPKLILFDWDDTLWDFQKNADETLEELAQKYALPIETPVLLSTYHHINSILWGQYQQQIFSQTEFRERRFKALFESLNLSREFNQTTIAQFSADYIQLCPQKKNLIPGAEMVLGELKGRGIRTAIATNGFHEVQEIKVQQSGLEHLLGSMYSPKSTGFRKPNGKYFEAISAGENVPKQDVWMVGDALDTDAQAAEKAGMRGVWLNLLGHKKGQFKNEISELPQIIEMLD